MLWLKVSVYSAISANYENHHTVKTVWKIGTATATKIQIPHQLCISISILLLSKRTVYVYINLFDYWDLPVYSFIFRKKILLRSKRGCLWGFFSLSVWQCAGEHHPPDFWLLHSFRSFTYSLQVVCKLLWWLSTVSLSDLQSVILISLVCRVLLPSLYPWSIA